MAAHRLIPQPPLQCLEAGQFFFLFVTLNFLMSPSGFLSRRSPQIAMENISMIRTQYAYTVLRPVVSVRLRVVNTRRSAIRTKQSFPMLLHDLINSTVVVVGFIEYLYRRERWSENFYRAANVEFFNGLPIVISSLRYNTSSNQCACYLLRARSSIE